MTRNNSVRVFADITKVDEEQRLVYGYASTTSLDSQNEKISKSALEKALPEYMRWANIREMHGNSAAGTAESVDIDEKGAYLCAKIIDDNAWKKVVSKVYKGFSIGGKCVSKVDNEITELRLTEISLVDRPANAECVIELFKAEDIDSDVESEASEKPIDVPAIAEQAASEEKQPEVIPEKEDEAANAEAEKAEQAKDIKKGMYEVSCAASLLSQLDALQQCSVYERNHEGDSSPIPEKLKDIVRQLGDALKEMVAEEVDEIVNTDMEGATATDGDSMQLSENAIDIEKAGARNSKSDVSKIQGMHDMALELGAACKAEKAEGSEMHKIDELNGELKKVSQENEALKKQVEELSKTVLPAKGVQKVIAVSKEQDTGVVAKAEEEVKNPVDAIRKVHNQGPSFIIGGR